MDHGLVGKSNAGIVRLAFFLLVLASPVGFALEAILEVNEDPWYTERKDAKYGGAEITDFFAPLPVFFEGWKSTPRSGIIDYRWNFGDGSPIEHGFNTAHVYENPGTYTATLTVDDGTSTSSDTITIKVRARNGTTYYVDAATGNDSNSGLSPGAAWRTATKAFVGMNDTRYGPGDQVLFRRGQTFELRAGEVVPPHGKAGYGYIFSAFGNANDPKPVLRYTTGSDNIISLTGNGLAHFTMKDLTFRLQNTAGDRPGELMFSTQEVNQILFLRVDIDQMSRGFVFSQGVVDNNRASGVFIVGCNLHDSEATQLYMRVSRMALLNNIFDFSGNHIAYLNHVNMGAIVGNTFSRPAFGRSALRLNGDGAPTNNVYIARNRMQGWIDPRTGGPAFANGQRYNWNLVALAPNGPWLQEMRDVVFEENIVSNAERLLMVANYDNLMIRNNIFTSNDREEGPSIRIGYEPWEKKPIRNLSIIGNTIVLRGASNADSLHTGIGLFQYKSSSFQGTNRHTNIVIKNNIIQTFAEKRRALFIERNVSSLMSELHIDGNVYFSPNNAKELIQVGTTGTGGELEFSLATWKSFSGKDANSLHANPLLVDLIGPDGVFAGLVSDENFKPQVVSPAVDKGLVMQDLQFDFLRVPRPSGNKPDVGAFEQSSLLSVLTVGQGSVIANPAGGYVEGQTVSVTAVPHPNWSFTGWSGDISGISPTQNVTLNGDKTVIANFVQEFFDISIVTEGAGTVQVSPPGPYMAGEQVTLTATPSGSNTFLGWSGSFLSDASPLTFNITSDLMLTARFGSASTGCRRCPDFELVISGEGTVELNPLPPYPENSSAVAIAIPAPGWEFERWTGSFEVDWNPLPFDIEGNNILLRAEFIKQTFVINTSVQGAGEVSLVPAPTYELGESVTVSAVADESWAFVGWQGDLSGTQLNKTVDIQQDMDVVAVFQKVNPDLTLWVEGPGSVQQSDFPPFTHGESVTLTAMPDPGFIFVGWAGPIVGSRTSISTQVVLDGDAFVTAYFGVVGTTLPGVEVPFWRMGSRVKDIRDIVPVTIATEISSRSVLQPSPRLLELQRKEGKPTE